jgi:hypothetical protein
MNIGTQTMQDEMMNSCESMHEEPTVQGHRTFLGLASVTPTIGQQNPSPSGIKLPEIITGSVVYRPTVKMEKYKRSKGASTVLNRRKPDVFVNT